MRQWTIDQLVTEAERVLNSVDYKGQASARIREVPDKRTIRYYTTLGLLDRPAEMRGRTAYYGLRHLLQLLAIKNLQSRGATLGGIQQNLAGATEPALAEFAGLSVAAIEQLAAGEESPASPDMPPAPSKQRDSFWAATPTASTTPSPSTPAPCVSARMAVHLQVADGATLVLDGITPGQFDATALARLSPALERLSQALRELNLTERVLGDEPSPNGPTANHVC